jgi:hypothetical protein
MSSPGLTKTSAAKSRSIQAKRRRQTGGPSTPGASRVCPSDSALRRLRRIQKRDCALLMLHSLKRKAPLVPGSRDGLSVHTVRDDSWRTDGKTVPGNLHPPWQASIGFREHVRVRARSRTDDFAGRKILCCHGGGSDAENFTGCLPSERLRGGLAELRSSTPLVARAGVSGSRPRTAVSDIKEQETRATQSCTVVLCNRRSTERPVRW